MEHPGNSTKSQVLSQFRLFPMRGDAEHGLGLWQGSGDLGPGPAEFGVLDYVHRVTMSNEQSWMVERGLRRGQSDFAQFFQEHGERLAETSNST